jgi:bacterioferritin
MVGENPQEMLKSDLTLERTARDLYREAIAHCESCGDYVTRELLDGIQVETEGHIDWLETQLDLVERVGLQNYLRSQI